MFHARVTVCDLMRGCPHRDSQMVWDWNVEGNIEGNSQEGKKPKVRVTRCIVLELNQSRKRKK